jgi:hypothetical protein
MKLQEVDTEVTEGIMDLVKGASNTMGAAMGSRANRKELENQQAKKNFTSTFVKKMLGVISGQWLQVQQNQNELQRQAELIQQQYNAKGKNLEIAANPAAAEAERNAAAPVPAVSESYSLFNDLVEAAAKQPPPQVKKITMADYLVKVIMQYMQGVDIQPQMAAITQMCKMVELTYPQNHGLPALRKLGDTLYDLAATQKASSAPAVPEPSSPTEKTIISLFKQLDPVEQKAVLAKLKPS